MSQQPNIKINSPLPHFCKPLSSNYSNICFNRSVGVLGHVCNPDVWDKPFRIFGIPDWPKMVIMGHLAVRTKAAGSGDFISKD